MNQQMRQLRARLRKINDWLKQESVIDRPPTLVEVFDEIMTRRGQSTLTRIRNGAEILSFLTRNGISEIADLNITVRTLQVKLDTAGTELKKVERRIDTLKEHLRHSGHYKGNRRLNKQYEALRSKYDDARKLTGFGAERKAKKALEAASNFFEDNRAGLTLFAAADRYLRGVLQSRFDKNKLPPISMWEKELAGKLEARDSLYREYYALKDETQKVERIQRSVKDILHNDNPQMEQSAARKRGVEL